MTICIETALKAEAIPIIEAFDLKPLSGNHLFPIWENPGIKLIVSGIGKIKAGAACSYLAGIHQDEAIYGWLNIGIAGHANAPLGAPFLAHKIIDESRKNQFFPSFAFSPPCGTQECITVDHPERNYQTSSMYDMEASGFYAIASKISPIEMIHVFKVISDNKDHPIPEISKDKVINLIEVHIELIGKIVEEMQLLIQELSPIGIPFLDEFLKKWHFTTCETHRLQKLLKKWQLLCPQEVLLSQDLLKQKNTKEVLSFLESALSKISLELV